MFTAVVSFVNQFFYLRQTQILIGYSVVALVSLPLGHMMAQILPTREWTAFGYKFSFNPGPFSLKEHMLIGTMVACNTSTAYAIDIVILQHVFYEDKQPFIAGLLLVLTTQITGFSLAGAIRRFLVRPAHMVWPSTLVTASLFRSLHATADEDDEGNGRMPRMKYFLLVALGSFLYYWFPGFIFPTIGMISWICWINPDNIVLSQLTGTNGLGIGTIALDWPGASYYVQPLVTPWFAQVNILMGFIMVTYIMVPWAYYTNLWNSKNYPILSAKLFRENGSSYDKSQVLTDNILDEAKYLAYGPVRMDSFFALTYGVGFAALMATVVHVILYHGKEIVARWKSARAHNDDIHSRLMAAYPEVPDWWFGLLFMITLGLTVTNQQPGLNIVTEYVIGYLLPGHAIANVIFKTYGYVVNVQALTFTADLKLGHYMKIPSRVMFMAQLTSTVISGLVNLATAMWLVNSRPHICTHEGYPFTCRSTKTFCSASVIWGAIGPARVFGNKDGALYAPVQWGFLVGALLPIPFCNGLVVGFVFGFLIRRYRYDWWARFNYLTSAALDTGVAMCGLVIFFAIQSWEGKMPYWWGNPEHGILDHCPLGGVNFYGQ
ncbi:hypothetical protein BGZ72_001042 [Mortierella alpina]|nr:hypothetical protein BGZ72_001042 [Mortierella alpina]